MPDPFAHRAAPHTLPELMDAPAPLATLRGCLRSLESINRLTGAYPPTLRFLSRALAHAHRRGHRFTPDSPLRILDLGSGGGDTLVRVARWAAVRRLPVHLTGVDLNPQSAILARETELRRISHHPRLRPPHPIRWLTADALTLNPAPSPARTSPRSSTQPTDTEPPTGTEPAHHTEPPPDLILSSLFFHHLEDPEIIRVLRWQHRTARLGWFINDLARSPRAARTFALLAMLLRWHPFARHDGPVSFRRAFRRADWQHLLHAAGIPLAQVTLLPTRPARLCLEHLD